MAPPAEPSGSRPAPGEERGARSRTPASRGRGGEEGACTEQSGIRAAGEAAAGSAGDVRAEEGGQTHTVEKVCAALLSGAPSERFQSPTPS